MAEEKDVKELGEEKNDNSAKKGKKSIFSRFWNGLIRLHGDDFEKRLQYIHREEAIILARMKRRSMGWRKTARNIIVSSLVLEVIAIGYAIMITRSVILDSKMRALRVLPIFVLPVLSWALYSGLQGLMGMCDRRDQRTLESLRAERQTKINELKERTDYYNTQQLIQRYDPDPAAKAAAASVLASKLGADSGLHVFVDESHLNQHGIGKSSDTEWVQSSGLRRRNPSEARSPGSNFDKETFQYARSEASEISLPSELVVDHQNTVPIGPQDGGWVARLAALLVGEDPTQSYALICGNCHMHNGLARKEDFLVITYYCPHCHALNKPRNWDESSTAANSPNMRSLMTHSPNMKSVMAHPHALNRDNIPSDTNTPDMRSSTTHHRAMNKSRKSGEISYETDTIDMRSSKTHRYTLNRPENSDEKSSDCCTPNTKSPKTMANANLNEQNNDSMSRSGSPITTPVPEIKKVVAEDHATH
uniref:uncharacterized protein At2g24330-like n=1 Tax=Erigeron canadensis TaxID=72917 RepID=UPI001CB99E09|nr:uncharacterized protein At2g24330-like [Erigeron canadensis]